MISSEEVLRDLHVRMVRIRRFEEAVDRLRGEGEVPGLVHLSIGAEAVAAGVGGALRVDDRITSSHRPHGHLIAKGGDPNRIMAELLGRTPGSCGGRGGSMHLTDLDRGFLGSHGIVGAGIPIAVGAAFAIDYRGTDAVAVAFFGDGATNIGAFHEAANLAAALRLPVVFVCENNDVAMGSPRNQTMAIDDVADRAAAYGMHGVVVDGNDVIAVHDVALAAVSAARRGGGPTLIEAKVRRPLPVDEPPSDPDDPADGSGATSMATPATDPITRLEERMISAGFVDATLLDAVHREVQQTIDEAVEFARSSDHAAAIVDPLVELSDGSGS